MNPIPTLIAFFRPQILRGAWKIVVLRPEGPTQLETV
jgi:hypothetical protein